MNLTQITLDKLNELGTKASAEYFGVKEGTIKNWLNTGKVPATAAQRVLDDMTGPAAGSGPMEVSAPKDTSVVTPERLTNIEFRLAIIESKVIAPTGISTVPPQQNWTAPHNFRK
jgi:hypothetical protein